MSRPSPWLALGACCRDPSVRVTIALAIACTASALLVSYYSARMRAVFRAEQLVVQQRDDLFAERGRLLLERGAFSSYSHVETVALNDLGMRVPAADETRLVLP